MFGSHYYGLNGKTRTLLERGILQTHGAAEFLRKCERHLGQVISEQAAALIERRGSFEDQNRNAMFVLLGFAIDHDEMNLALAIGDYFDRHP